jgi:hypothetical protein
VIVTTPHDRFAFDFVILSTGLVSDPRLRPELAALAPHIALWGDRVAMPQGQGNALIDAHPYLGPAFEFLPRTRRAWRCCTACSRSTIRR